MPAPLKHPSARARRNAPEPTTKLPTSGPTRSIPKAPKNVSASTRRWWRLVWSSPMAQVWLDADVPALERLARLIDARDSGVEDRKGAATELAEIRQLEDRFGLSPLARRRLQWELDNARDLELARLAEAEERAVAATSGPDAPAADDDEGRFMRVVEGGKAS